MVSVSYCHHHHRLVDLTCTDVSTPPLHRPDLGAQRRRFIKLTSTMPNWSTGVGASLSPCRPTPPARLDWGLRLTTSAEPCHYSGVPNSLLGHLGLGLGPRPCRGLRTLSDLSQINGRLHPATSPNRVINTEHINQLSCFHAKKLSVLNIVRFDQALYFSAQSCL